MSRAFAYRLAAPFYDLAMAGSLRKARRDSIASLALKAGETLLIPGIGTGLDLSFLPTDVDVLGGDLVPSMLAKAKARRARLGLGNVSLLTMDAQALPLPDASFDAVLLHLIVAVAPDGRAVLTEACRVLIPGGRIAVLDKFLPDDQARVPLWRHAAQALVSPFTDLNRRFHDLAKGLPLLVIQDEGVMFGRTFRSILPERIPSSRNHFLLLEVSPGSHILAANPPKESAMPESLDPVLTTAWIHPDPVGLWFNTTDASASGNVLAGGTFEFTRTANFGFYVLNQAGTVIQSDIWDGAYQGVFWVKLSADGAIVAGGGWLTSDYVGQLRAISVSDGTVLLNQQTGSRVNQIDMTPNGSLLAAGCGATYSGSGQQIYLFAMQGGAYTPLTGYTSTNNSAIQSLALSADGQWLVAALYGSPNLILFQVTATGLVQKQTWTIPASSAAVEPMEADVRHYVMEYTAANAVRGMQAERSGGGAYVKFVAITPDGSKFAVAVSGAKGLFYFDRDTFISSGSFQWQYILAGISTSSCLSISADGRFVVGLSNGSGPELGHAYRVNNGSTSGTLAWSTAVEYWPNPSNRILGGGDALVSFGTGEPNKDGTLSPGRYYVLDASNGALLGKYATPKMNWPFQMSADGTFAMGGSDDGHLYGFNSRGNWGAAI